MDSIMSLAFRARILLGSSEACPAHPCASPAHPSFMQRTLFVYPLSFHPLPHSFSQRRASNPFSINRLRTLSRSTEGGGCPPSFYPPVFRILFQVPYALTPLFATLTKTAGVYPLSSHSGTRHCLYLLMSSFASSRFSSGSRKGLVWSGAPLMACVISLEAAGKSPLFESTRASARWLTQWLGSFLGTCGYSSNARFAFPCLWIPRA